MRHGERADKVFEEGIAIEQFNDPPLTSAGKQMAYRSGISLRKHLNSMNINNVKIISSPFLRTL